MGKSSILLGAAGGRGVWVVDTYLPFQRDYEVMPERDFIALPRVTSVDLRVRATAKKII
jgi:hypothetical protein